jgi:hypothetical protein
MEKPHRFDAMIVDPDSSTRMRLKQATTSVAEFDKVFQSNSLAEATSRLDGGGPLDVCFLSASIEQSQLDSFITQAKAHKNGQDAAYICVMKGNSHASTSVASNVISGFDGMLFEPYSVDQLVELTRIAARVRKERSGAREQAAVSIIVGDLIKQLDQLAFVKSQGVDPTNLMRKFKNSADTLKRLQPESFQVYFSQVVESFVSAPVPQVSKEIKSYQGPSSRVKRKQQDRLTQEAEKIAASE